MGDCLDAQALSAGSQFCTTRVVLGVTLFSCARPAKLVQLRAVVTLGLCGVQLARSEMNVSWSQTTAQGAVELCGDGGQLVHHFDSVQDAQSMTHDERRNL